VLDAFLTALLADGAMLPPVALVMAGEGGWLGRRHRRDGHPGLAGAAVANTIAGISLVACLYLALRDAPLAQIAIAMTAALIAHLAELRLRTAR